MGITDKWTCNNVTVTLKQILDLTKSIPVQNIPIQILKNKLLEWDDINEYKKSVNLKYPVLIIVNNDNDILYILDGHHRIHKAINKNLTVIKAKLIKLRDLPENFQYVLK